MKSIFVRGSIRQAKVDDEDFDKVRFHTWHIHKGGNTIYAETKINGKNVRMHNLIMGAIGIDHINRDGLDNRKANLRLATHSQQLMNYPKRKDTISQYRGVTFFKRDKIWIAQICINKSNKHLGRFSSEIEAARAYDRAASRLFKDFAVLNFPRKDNNDSQRKE